ncbi:MAG: DUF904 domain-containing protein [Pseudomonadales bacterium]|nr:DUF904 domain-containing protein [Pseudomonadales bacterium]
MAIQELETKIDELILLCDKLEKSQAVMQTDQKNWQLERVRLLEKNQLAKTKLEAMILRLKALEEE